MFGFGVQNPRGERFSVVLIYRADWDFHERETGLIGCENVCHMDARMCMCLCLYVEFALKYCSLANWSGSIFIMLPSWTVTIAC